MSYLPRWRGVRDAMRGVRWGWTRWRGVRRRRDTVCKVRGSRRRMGKVRRAVTIIMKGRPGWARMLGPAWRHRTCTTSSWKSVALEKQYTVTYEIRQWPEGSETQRYGHREHNIYVGDGTRTCGGIFPVHPPRKTSLDGDATRCGLRMKRQVQWMMTIVDFGFWIYILECVDTLATMLILQGTNEGVTPHLT